jgi:hypothetical protein
MHSCNCRLLAWQASCFLLAQPTGYVPLSCSLLFGCSLGKEGVDEASLLCTCVFNGELSLLRRLLRAGARPDSGDYDRRTPLHIAAGGWATGLAEADCTIFSCFCCRRLNAGLMNQLG